MAMISSTCLGQEALLLTFGDQFFQAGLLVFIHVFFYLVPLEAGGAVILFFCLSTIYKLGLMLTGLTDLN